MCTSCLPVLTKHNTSLPRATFRHLNACRKLDIRRFRPKRISTYHTTNRTTNTPIPETSFILSHPLLLTGTACTTAVTVGELTAHAYRGRYVLLLRTGAQVTISFVFLCVSLSLNPHAVYKQYRRGLLTVVTAAVNSARYLVHTKLKIRSIDTRNRKERPSLEVEDCRGCRFSAGVSSRAFYGRYFVGGFAVFSVFCATSSCIVFQYIIQTSLPGAVYWCSIRQHDIRARCRRPRTLVTPRASNSARPSMPRRPPQLLLPCFGTRPARLRIRAQRRPLRPRPSTILCTDEYNLILRFEWPFVNLLLTQAAWSISIELLSASGALESASPLHYFSANTIYTKVRKHWHQLEAEHRDQLGGVILQVRSALRVRVRPGRGCLRTASRHRRP